MKTIFTLVSSLFISAAVIAAPADMAAKQKSMLTVKSTDNADISVVVDGRRFEPRHNSIMITGIDAGFHDIKIYRERNNGFFSIFGTKYEMVYSTSMLVKSKTSITMSVDRLGRTSIVETRLSGRGRDWNDRGRDNDYRDRDRNWNDDQRYDYDRDGKFGDYDDNYGYERGMDDREFRTVLQSIDKEWLESNKLKSATHIVQANKLSSAQVKQLVLMFSFENNKLELAKQAYKNTVDKKNYFMINDVLSFNSSKDELNRYIRNFH